MKYSMVRHDPTGTPLFRLVVVMVFLSLAGSLAAGLHYGAIDLPQQNAHQVPVKTLACDERCRTCMDTCLQEEPAIHTACFTMCGRGAL